MNNKIKKGLSYFSLFILALGMLPLGNILADEKVEPTKFVIEQNNLEANGFKIANDQVLTSEDVVKLSNVKSVDNLVDVNSLTVSDDQLANVNQVNPDGGLYNLTLTDGQQANITVPVVKEGSLTTTNSKGALIFKNLALSQEANSKEKVLEETGVYSVAFNNGYVNSDLTVDINENDAIVKDTNLGLCKELVTNGDTTTFSGNGKVVSVPNTQSQINDEAATGNLSGAIAKGEQNLQATIASSEVISVSTYEEFQSAMDNAAGKNIVIDVISPITLQVRDYSRMANSTVTIKSSNKSVITLGNSGSGDEYLGIKSDNVTLNFKDITVKGLIGPNEAKTIGMGRVDGSKFTADFICSYNNGLTINTYSGFEFKDMYESGDGYSGAFLATWWGAPTLNMYGGEFSNINGRNIVSANYSNQTTPQDCFKLNVYNINVHDTFTRDVGIFAQEDANRSNVANFYGGDIHDNVNGSNRSRGAVLPMKERQLNHFVGAATQIGADFKVYNNYTVDASGIKKQQANLSLTATDYNNQFNLAQKQVILNPTPNSNIHIGNSGFGQNGRTMNIDNMWENITRASYFAQFNGMPLAQIKYTDENLKSQYQGNGVAEGIYSDWKEGSSDNRTITLSGNYNIIEKVVNGQSYAVLVKEYTNVTIKGVTDPAKQNLYTENTTIASRNSSVIPAKQVEGFVVKSAKVTTNDGGGLPVGSALNPVKDQQGIITGFEINPKNRENAPSNMTVEIVYEKEQTNYTVHFDGNGNTSGTMADQSIPTGTATPLTTNTFKKDGYVFAGWNTVAVGTGTAYTDGQSVTDLATTGQSITLYAQWTPITYTVKFAGGAGANGSMNDLTLTYDNAANLTANAFTKPGYTFQNWSGDNGQTYTDGQEVKNLTTEASKVITLTANWTANTYTINFDGNKGNASTDVTGTTNAINKTYGQAINVPANGFNHEGYTFKEWNTQADGKGTSYAAGSQITTDLTDTNTAQTLYAIWTPITYKVHFEGNGGKAAMQDQDMTFDQAANLTANTFVNPGKEFAGWSTQTGGPVEYRDQQSVKNLANTQAATVILYAQWQDNQSYTITYDANQGTGKTEAQTQPLGTPIQLQQNGFTREGYTFKEWNTQADGKGTSYQPGQAITNEFSANTTLYAIWEGQTVTISFNGNGGQGNMNNQTVKVGEATKLSKNAFTNQGKTFAGWATSAQGPVVYTDEASVTDIVKDTTLYAVWTTNAEYTITYDANGGKGTTAAQTQALGVSVTLQQNGFTRDGYTFKEWNTNKDGNGDSYTQGQVLATGLPQSTTLYAIWEAKSYAVNFIANGGKGTMAPQSFVYGETKALSTNAFTREGYEFLGWAKDPNASAAEYTDAQQVSNLTTESSVNLYAVWQAKKLHVTYDGNGSTSGTMAAQEFTAGENVKLTANAFVKDGFTFTGWNTQQDGSGIGYADGATINNLTQDTTLYAQWRKADAQTYTVIFVGNGADGEMANQVITIDQATKLNANAFTRPGYEFTGWNTKANGKGDAYTDGQEVTNLTTAGGTVILYAQWQLGNGPIVNPDGSITVPGADGQVGTGDDVTIKPGPNGDKPTINPDGNVVVPDGATVIRPGGAIVPPNGSVVKPDGTILTPNNQELNPDGTVTLPGKDNTLGTNDDIVVTPNGNPTPQVEVNPDGSVTLPNGGTVKPGAAGKPVTVPNGSIVKPNGDVVVPGENNKPVIVRPNQDGTITLPGKDNDINTDKDNVVVKPNNGNATINPDGSILLPEGGEVTLPDGSKVDAPAGSIVKPDGTIQLPNGTQINPDGTVTVPGPDGKPDTDDDVTINKGPNGEKPTIDPNTGNVIVPNGATVTTPNGEITVPNGTQVKPDGTIVYPGGTEQKPDGEIVQPGPDGKPDTDDDTIIKPNPDKPEEKPEIKPDGSIVIPPGGSITKPGGETVFPDGGILNPDGTVTLPGKDNVPGNGDDVTIKPNEDGSITIPGVDGQLGTDDDHTVTPKPGSKPSVDYEGNITLPEGGTVTRPNGDKVEVQPGGVVKPDGTIVQPDGTIIAPDGTITNPDGSITNPGEDGKPGTDDDITVKPDPNKPDTKPEQKPDGSIVIPPGGSITTPGGETVLPDGGILNPDGTVTVPGEDGQLGNQDDVTVKPNPDGSITIPGVDGQLGTDDDHIVKPTPGSKPELNGDGSITLPQGGTVVRPNGQEVTVPNGSIVKPDGTIILPDGSIIKPDQTTPDNSITSPGEDGKPGTDDDITVKPNPDKPTEKPEQKPDGSIVIPPGGSVTTPGGESVLPDGGILNPDGTITVPGEDGKPGTDDDVTVKPNPDGSITIPGVDGQLGTEDDQTVKPAPGTKPEINGDGSITLPQGGTVVRPDGQEVPVQPGGVVKPDGTIVQPDGTIVDPNGNITNPDGSITNPGEDGKPGTNDDVTVKPDPNNPTVKPETKPDGSITIPPGGSVTTPGGESVLPDGGILNPDGSITIPGEDGQLGTEDDQNVKPAPGTKPEINGNGDITLPGGGTVTRPNGDQVQVPGGSIVHPDGSITLPDGNVVGPNEGMATTQDGKGYIIADNRRVHSNTAIAEIKSEQDLITTMNARAFYNGKAVPVTVNTNDLATIEAGIVGDYPVTFSMSVDPAQTKARAVQTASVTRIYSIYNEQTPMPNQPTVNPTNPTTPQAGTNGAHTGAAISFGLVTVIAVAGLALIAIRRNRK